MKKKILIFSAGSAGREVNQLISSINKISENWEVVGYVDNDKSKIGKTIDGLNVYSNSNKPHNKDIYAICGIMDGSLRKKILTYRNIYHRIRFAVPTNKINFRV